MTLKIAALASGRGSNVASIIRHCKEGRLDAEIVLVLSNNPDAPVIQVAKDHGIAVWSKDHKTFPDRASFDAEMALAIGKAGADTIALAGYMRLLSPEFIQTFPGRILNIHPSLLPAFPGTHGGEDAANYGVRLSGCTVHFVDEALDSGPVIIQAAIALGSQDTAMDFMPRIHAMEHRIYPQALQWLAEERLSIEGRKVLLRGEKPQTVMNLPQGCIVSPPLEGF